MEFKPYPKTPCLKRSVVITEKIDGTNSQIVIVDNTDNHMVSDGGFYITQHRDGRAFVMRPGSRNRWIAPGKLTDNFGFAKWCFDNADELFKLGEGQHFGEWYGQGIERGYGLTERRFALFNTARWGAHNPDTPACCEVVPVLRHSDLEMVGITVECLRKQGSLAVPGFMNPEGVIVYHTAAKQSFKVLLEGDEMSKTESERLAA